MHHCSRKWESGRKVRLTAKFLWEHREFWESQTFTNGITKERKSRDHEDADLTELGLQIQRYCLKHKKSCLVNLVNLDTPGNSQKLSQIAFQGQNVYAITSLAASITTYYLIPKQENL